MGRLVIRGGEIVTNTDRYISDVYCEDGRIAAIGENLEVPNGTEEVDAAGKFVFPGGIDAHTHMELPFMGGCSSDDFFTGTRAGLAGGTTTIIDFAVPGTDQSLLETRDAWLEKGEKACADYALHMCITSWDERVEREMRELALNGGITSFKVFMAYTGYIGIDDDQILNVLQTAKEVGALVSAHCEHGLAVQREQARLIAAGKTHPKYHPVSRPSWLEGEAANRFFALARMVDTPVYMVHTSAREALEAAYRARQEGQLVYVETCPQYLLLDDTCYDTPDFEGAAYVMSPPIRPKGHQDPLWAGLANGIVQTVATDHCPFRQADQKIKGKDDFTKIPNGAGGIENRMQLVYTYGVETGRISLERFVDSCCTAPAKLFGLYPRKGAVRVGSDADLVVYDPKPTGTISAETHFHAVDRNIFEGFEVKGAVDRTISGGKVVFADGKPSVERGAGRFLHRG